MGFIMHEALGEVFCDELFHAKTGYKYNKKTKKWDKVTIESGSEITPKNNKATRETNETIQSSAKKEKEVLETLKNKIKYIKTAPSDIQIKFNDGGIGGTYSTFYLTSSSFGGTGRTSVLSATDTQATIAEAINSAIAKKKEQIRAANAANNAVARKNNLKPYKVNIRRK